MKYTAWVRRPRGLFWQKIKNIKGDLAYEATARTKTTKTTKSGVTETTETTSSVPLPVRVLILEDETRMEIPMTWAIRFSPERFYSIKGQMEKESGQKLPI